MSIIIVPEEAFRERCEHVRAATEHLQGCLVSGPARGLIPAIVPLAARLSDIATELGEQLALAEPKIELEQLRNDVLYAALQSLAEFDRLHENPLPDVDCEPDDERTVVRDSVATYKANLDRLGVGFIEDDLELLRDSTCAIATRLLKEIAAAVHRAHITGACGELRGWLLAGGPLPDWSACPEAVREFSYHARGVCFVPFV